MPRKFASVPIIVVVGHVMQQFDGYNDNVLFNIIFSIQMPLFMMVSGYAVTYSTPITDKKTLWGHLTKRLRALLLPWACFTILAFFFIDLSHHNFVDFLKYSAYHMESAFWFLFSLWTIDLLFSVATFIGSICKRNQELMKTSSFLLLVGGAFLIGTRTGLSFLGIKYSVYYSIYFLAGYWFAKLKKKVWEKYKNPVICVLMIAYAILIHFFNIESMPDMSPIVLVRILISLIGCILVFYWFGEYELKHDKAPSFLTYSSNHSLEMYLCQCVVLPFIRVRTYNLNTIEGFYFFLIYTAVVFALTYLLIVIIDSNMFSRLILFGKK